jgi:hypothetical protein
MELRQLSTDSDRQDFARSLVETRTIKGAGFSETKRSHLGEVHLAYGNLFALYDDQGPQPGEMLGGFALHDLGSFPQSYPKPDLCHLPPESVFECGELWARAAGGARLIRQAAWILVGCLRAQAVLVYPILKPWNLSLAYKDDFDRVGEPIEWPYARTLDGGSIWVQAMVSQGENIGRSIQAAGQFGFEVNPYLGCIRFNSPFGLGMKRSKCSRKESERRSATASEGMFSHMVRIVQRELAKRALMANPVF